MCDIMGFETMTSGYTFYKDGFFIKDPFGLFKEMLSSLERVNVSFLLTKKPKKQAATQYFTTVL